MSTPHQRRLLSTLFDSGALITAATFQARGVLVIDHLLACCRIGTLLAVKQETVDAGLLPGYPDAAELDQGLFAERGFLLELFDLLKRNNTSRRSRRLDAMGGGGIS